MKPVLFEKINIVMGSLMKKYSIFMLGCLVVLLGACAKKQIIISSEAVKIPIVHNEPGIKPILKPIVKPKVVIVRKPSVKGTILEVVHFTLDSVKLNNADIQILTGLKDTIIKSDSELFLEGHCDEQGSIEYNYGLGQRRANSVKAFLVKLGIPENNINAVSNGKDNPVDLEHNEKAWAKNRRVEVKLLP